MRKPSGGLTRPSRTQRVIFQPETAHSLQKGINQVANLIRPTYGPLAGIVAFDRTFLGTGKGPELLDNGGTIVRRFLQIPDRHANMGVMLVRDALKHLQDQAGDGTAAAAIMLQTVFNEGLRVVAAGANAMRLRGHLENGMRLILDELDRMSSVVEGEEALARLALTISGDPELASLLGEIFEVIGEFGRLEIRKGGGLAPEREYVEGMYWEEPLAAREMVTDLKTMSANLDNAAVLISNLEIDDAAELAPFLDRVVKAGFSSLLMITRGVSDQALGMLTHPLNRAKIKVAAVKTPDPVGNRPLEMLLDLAILTGGRPVLKESGDSLPGVRLEDLGRARRAWADTQTFGVVGGKGAPRVLREHIARLREQYLEVNQVDDRQKIQQRIGKLLGGTATLWIGAANSAMLDDRVGLAERTSEALRSAMIGGVVPGGGAALLACQGALREMRSPAGKDDMEQYAAYRILLRALEEPLRVIVRSAAENPDRVIEQLRRAGEGWGFDAIHARVVCMAAAGILDPTPVIKAAVQTAVSTAALALTTDTLVHRKDPQASMYED